MGESSVRRVALGAVAAIGIVVTPVMAQAQDQDAARPASPAASPAAPVEDATPAGTTLDAALSETVVRLPVTVQPIFGDPRQGEMIVTHFRPPGDGPFPVVVMNHGRTTKDRATPARMRFVDVARYWVRRGAAVVVPTRLGYGDTGLEPDPEETGPCDRKRYDVAARNTNAQLGAVLEFVGKQPWADAKRVIVMGQSMGGFATVAFMSQKHPGVIAGINFAGGGGGDPEKRIANPCRHDQMAEVFAGAGKANAGATPMLWSTAKTISTVARRSRANGTRPTSVPVATRASRCCPRSVTTVTAPSTAAVATGARSSTRSSNRWACARPRARARPPRPTSRPSTMRAGCRWCDKT